MSSVKGSRRKARKAVPHWSKLPPEIAERVVAHRQHQHLLKAYREECRRRGIAL